MQSLPKFTTIVVPLILALSAAGCESPSSGSPAGLVTLTGKVNASPAVPPSGALNRPPVAPLSAGPDSIRLTRVRVLLRHVRFDRDSSTGEFRTEPIVLDLAGDGSLREITAAALPEGEYRRIRFKVHRIEEEDLRGMSPASRPVFGDFLAGDRYSVIAEGRVFTGGAATGEPFTYRSRVDEEQEQDLVPPLAVDGGASVTVTMTLDAASWFIAPGSGLLDPRAPENAALIDEKIKSSIDVFEDNDRDGTPY